MLVETTPLYRVLKVHFLMIQSLISLTLLTTETLAWSYVIRLIHIPAHNDNRTVIR